MAGGTVVRTRLIGRWRAAILAAVVLLGVAGTAFAAGGQQIRFNAADQAAARATVLRLADLGTASSWKGGMKKPDLSPTPTCANFHPKQSDLVLTGAAESDFQSTNGLDFDSEVQVLQTAHMVSLDWQRSVLPSTAIPCLRSHIVKSLGSGSKLVSFTRIPLPQIATYTAAFRIVITVTQNKITAHVLIEPFLIGKGRSEITLTALGPQAAQATVTATAVRLARLLAGRAHA